VFKVKLSVGPSPPFCHQPSPLTPPPLPDLSPLSQEHYAAQNSSPEFHRCRAPPAAFRRHSKELEQMESTLPISPQRVAHRPMISMPAGQRERLRGPYPSCHRRRLVAVTAARQCRPRGTRVVRPITIQWPRLERQTEGVSTSPVSQRGNLISNTSPPRQHLVASCQPIRLCLVSVLYPIIFRIGLNRQKHRDLVKYIEINL
jgi:hypothetical protein